MRRTQTLGNRPESSTVDNYVCTGRAPRDCCFLVFLNVTLKMKSSRFPRKYEFSLCFVFFPTNVHAFRLYAVSVLLVYVNSTFNVL